MRMLLACTLGGFVLASEKKKLSNSVTDTGFSFFPAFVLFKVAYYSFIRVQEVYTINVQI